MTKTEKATQYMEAIARDDSHGYSQYNRNGNPDFDCSSLTIRAWREAGLKLSGATYTENMDAPMLAEGFQDVTSKVNIATGSGLKRGDVLRRKGHVGMYCGNLKQVEACMDEVGDIRGDRPGDQYGWEIAINPYSGNWTKVLRYTAEDDKSLKKGLRGTAVKKMQTMLIELGYSCGASGADGYFEKDTEKAVKKFQSDKELEQSGIYDDKTKKALESAYKKKTEAEWKATGTAICALDDSTIRMKPKNGVLIGRMQCGQRFEIDGKKSGSWSHIKINDVGVCWILTSHMVKDAVWKAKGTATCTGNGVNVRAKANSKTDKNILGKVKNGQRFEVDGKKSSNGNWIHVNVSGIGIGWMHQRYVKYDK